MKAHDRKLLNAEVQIGHQSTAWCNLADVALRAGKHYSHDKAVAVQQELRAWGSLVDQIEQHLKRNKVDIKKSKFQLGPMLEFDADTQKFVGDGCRERQPLSAARVSLEVRSAGDCVSAAAASSF